MRFYYITDAFRFAKVKWTPEWIRRARAYFSGLFWIPCPLCERSFAGYEWHNYFGRSDTISGERPGSGQGICPWCTVGGLGQKVWW